MSSVVHFEFSVPNREEAAAFYSAVFGWSITKLADPIRYWQIRTAEAPAQRAIPGGIVPQGNFFALLEPISAG